MPQALVIGVPYETFGKLNPKKLEPFRDAFKMAQDEARANLWLQGLYFKMAVASAFNKEAEYPDKPLDLTANQSDGNSEQTISEVQNKATRFSAWTKAFNQNFIQQHPEGQ